MHTHRDLTNPGFFPDIPGLKYFPGVANRNRDTPGKSGVVNIYHMSSKSTFGAVVPTLNLTTYCKLVSYYSISKK